MSLHPQTDYTVPAETAKVARAIFPKGNLCITMLDSLSFFLCDHDFSALFSKQGQPGGVADFVMKLMIVKGITLYNRVSS